MGKPHFNRRGENSTYSWTNPRNENHTNLRTIQKEQKITHGVNNLKALQASNRNAFDIRKEIQTLEQLAVVEKPAVQHHENLLLDQHIQIINNAEDCRLWLPTLKSHCDECSVIGFDCEWIPTKKRRPVALLQLATYRGLCLLIRLCFIQTIPEELKEILEDDKIVKIGVVPEKDAKLLNEDYGIKTKSTLDLRHMAKLVGCEPRSLKLMAEKYLNIKMDQKNWKTFYKWENQTLDKNLIDYAAMDVHAAIELFKFFANKLQPMNVSEPLETNVQSVIDNYCKVYIDEMFMDVPPGVTKCQIVTVTHVDDCRSWLKILQLYCNELNVLGFHCNVVQTDDEFSTVLQIASASFNGLCLLVYLDTLEFIPIELKEILENSNIIKVGINPRNQAQFLIQHYSIFVGSILDLCEMDKSTDYSPINLQKMCKADFNVKFNEGTNFAFVLVELFKKFAEKLQPTDPFEDRKVNIERVIREYCSKYVDMSFG